MLKLRTALYRAYDVSSCRGDKQILIWGDVANHYVFRYSTQRVLWFDDDPEQAIATRKRVLTWQPQIN